MRERRQRHTGIERVVFNVTRRNNSSRVRDLWVMERRTERHESRGYHPRSGCSLRGLHRNL